MSNETVLTIKAGLAGVFGLLTALWGRMGWLVLIWGLLMLADWMVGSYVAGVKGEWSSAKLREGARHKMGMVICVAVAGAADLVLWLMASYIPAVGGEYKVVLTPLVILWFIIGELGSLAEHAVAMGTKVPGWLLRVLKASKAAVDQAGDKLVPEEQEDEDGTHR